MNTLLASIPATAPTLGDHEIVVDVKRPGLGHIYYEGRCGAAVTIDDIKRKFYCEFFGGRDAKVIGGWWTAIEYCD